MFITKVIITIFNKIYFWKFHILLLLQDFLIFLFINVFSEKIEKHLFSICTQESSSIRILFPFLFCIFVVLVCLFCFSDSLSVSFSPSSLYLLDRAYLFQCLPYFVLKQIMYIYIYFSLCLLINEIILVNTFLVVIFSCDHQHYWRNKVSSASWDMRISDV